MQKCDYDKIIRKESLKVDGHKEKKPLTEDSTWITRVSGMEEHCN